MVSSTGKDIISDLIDYSNKNSDNSNEMNYGLQTRLSTFHQGNPSQVLLNSAEHSNNGIPLGGPINEYLNNSTNAPSQNNEKSFYSDEFPFLKINDLTRHDPEDREDMEDMEDMDESYNSEDSEDMNESYDMDGSYDMDDMDKEKSVIEKFGLVEPTPTPTPTPTSTLAVGWWVLIIIAIIVGIFVLLYISQKLVVMIWEEGVAQL